MKTIILKGPTVIAGAVRYPVEGMFEVDDDTADRLKEAGQVEIEGEEDEEVDAEHDPLNADGLDEMTLPDLGILVTKEGVPLNGASKKADIIAAIRAHRAPAA